MSQNFFEFQNYDNYFFKKLSESTSQTLTQNNEQSLTRNIVIRSLSSSLET